MNELMNKDECILALKTKATEKNRLPQKSDFNEYEVARIKALFGPWPRALEAAELIPSKEQERTEKKLIKRISAKRKKTEAIKGK